MTCRCPKPVSTYRDRDGRVCCACHRKVVTKSEADPDERHVEAIKREMERKR